MSDSLPAIRLKPGRERSLLRHHPWIFSGAIANVPTDADGKPLKPGAFVRVLSTPQNTPLGIGFFSPASQIRVRMLSFGDNAPLPTPDWLRNQINDAANRRRLFQSPADRNAFRIVHGESDGLPGLVIDRYDNILSVQILSTGFEAFREVLPEILFDLFPDVIGIYERSDATARTREGLPPKSGELARRPGTNPDYNAIEICLGNGIRSVIDIPNGQKTGSYLDQTLHHALVGKLADNRDVLDAFCYDGGFGLACLQNGAKHVTEVDASDSALSALKANFARNGISKTDRFEIVKADVFQFLRSARDARRTFDLIILDPPKFAETQAHLQRACRAYKDINLLALNLLRPGGLLATFSCSGALSPALFQTVLAEAATDAGREARIVAAYHQPADHPVSLSFPEGLYLKGFLLSV